MTEQFKLEVNQEYPAGAPIDVEVHGPHSKSRFTVMTSGYSIFKDCRFEGWGSLFSSSTGEIITDVKFFRLQP